MRNSFEYTFPDHEFISEHRAYLPFLQHNRIEKFTQELINKYDKEDNEIIIIGFSWGGIIGREVTLRSQHASYKLITVNTPNKLVATKPGVPSISFGSYFDIFVPFFLTRLGAHHHYFFTDHFVRFIFSQKYSDSIAQEARKLFY